MSLAQHRRDRGVTQDELALILELEHKGSVSAIETGREVPSLQTAMRIQIWTQNQVLAADMRPKDRDLIEAFEAAGRRRLSTPQPAEVAA